MSITCSIGSSYTSLLRICSGTLSSSNLYHASPDQVLMDTNDERAPLDGEPSTGAGDWRNQLQLDSRRRIVCKITEMLKRHLPFNGEEGLLEVEDIAARFEEKMYVAASSQSDYLRKISLKMLILEIKSQITIPPSNLKRHRVLA